MIDVYYNAIRVTQTEENSIQAIVIDASGEEITDGDMRLYVKGTDIEVIGVYDEGWIFTIPAANLKGRYFYNISYEGITIQFEKPIYFD